MGKGRIECGDPGAASLVIKNRFGKPEIFEVAEVIGGLGGRFLFGAEVVRTRHLVCTQPASDRN